MVNISGEVVLYALFFLQLVLTVFLILINLKRDGDRSIELHNERKEMEGVVTSFSENCKKYFLTSREIEILKLIGDGLPYKIIAAQLHISEYTVGTHVKNMFSKVNVSNKMELVCKIKSDQ